MPWACSALSHSPSADRRTLPPSGCTARETHRSAASCAVSAWLMPGEPAAFFASPEELNTPKMGAPETRDNRSRMPGSMVDGELVEKAAGSAPPMEIAMRSADGNAKWMLFPDAVVDGST